MSLDSSMDKVLERRREVEERLSVSANITNNDLAQLSRELSDLRPICDQIELVRRIEAELADALLMVDEAGDDSDMLEMAQAEAALLKAQMPEAHDPTQVFLKTTLDHESRMLESSFRMHGSWMLNAASQMLVAGIWMFNTLDAECWMLHAACWMLHAEY